MQKALPSFAVPLVVAIIFLFGRLSRGAGACGVRVTGTPSLALFASPAALFSRDRAHPRGRGEVCAASRPLLMPATRVTRGAATARGASAAGGAVPGRMPAVRKLATTSKIARSAKGGAGEKDKGSEAALLAELEVHTEILWPAKKKRKDSPAQKEPPKGAGGAQKRRKPEDGGEAPQAAAPGEMIPATPAEQVGDEGGGATPVEGKAKGGKASGGTKKGRGGKAAAPGEGNLATPAQQVGDEVGGAAPEEGKAKGRKASGGSKKGRGGKGVEPLQRDPPEGWRAIYDLALELRKERDAPVDWAGSESLGTDRATGEVDKYHSMIALMLSSQTKDQVVAEAMGALKTMPGGLKPESVLKLSDEQLDSYIAKVGFHNNKVKFIKQASQLLLERHGGQVPGTAAELIDLPGIGPKMAYILLKVAFNIVEGIGVDTHMHRIFNVLGWVESKQPEQTRMQLQSWLPREEWGEINVLFVGLGQMTQQPVERAKLMRRCIDSSRPVEALQLVARLGADTNASDPETGDTPLHYAARVGNVEVVETLLRPPFSARTASVNRAGHTALKVAQDGGHGAIVRLLS